MTRTLADRLARAVTTRDGRLSRGRLCGAVATGYLVFVATYVPINHWSIGRPAHVLRLPLEERIPFEPAWEALYVLTYVLPLLCVVAIPDARRCAQCAGAFLLTLVVAYATYALFPVYLERPRFEVDSLATWLLALEYRDPSYNHFPSLHVALSWLVYLACREGLSSSSWLLLLVIGISASTLFVKQHYLVDVLYGTGLAAAAWRCTARWAGP